MAGILQHLRSSTLDKRPNPGSMVDGQVAINYASGSPGLFFKDSAGALVKVGPVHVGTTAPNVSPASGGTAGNSRGEQWLDTSGGSYVMKIWDGSAWRTEAGEFVNATGDIMTGALGMPPASAGSPTIYFSGDTDTGIYSPGANQLAISTSGTGRLFVDASGNVGIGETNPNRALVIKSAASEQLVLTSTSGSLAGLFFNPNGSTYTPFLGGTGQDIVAYTLGNERLRITSDGKVGIGTSSPGYTLDVAGVISANATVRASNGTHVGIFGSEAFAAGVVGLGSGSNHPLVLGTNSIERLRIDSSGRLLVGTSSARTKWFNLTLTGPLIQAESGSNQMGVSSTYTANDASGPIIALGKTRGSSYEVVSSGDDAGVITFQGGDGSEMVEAARITAQIDGTPGANDMPGRLVFSTTPDNQSPVTGPVERMRISQNGQVLVAHETTSSVIQAESSIASGYANSIFVARFTGYSPNTTSNYFFYGEDTTGARAYIRSNGGLVNYQANDVNLSDRNAKKDITPAAGTWDCIKDWEIVNYRYKDQPDDADLNLGVIAQQVAESCPEVITVFEEAKDDQPEKLGVKEQQMYWMAIKALQEAQLRIETLEAKVAALESA